MPRPYRHVLITRFNVEIAYAESGRGIEDGWLRDRLEVFNRITVPSILSQRRPLDAWLVFFNERSPDWFRQDIASRDYLTPVWIDGPLRDGRIPAELQARGLADRDYLITSRVDNDDALSERYVERVQELFDHQPRLFIEFPHGVEYADGDYFHKRWRSNPFLSLIERVGPEVDTVICRPHTEVRRQEPTVSVWERNMWLQNSHRFSTTSPQVRNIRPFLGSHRPHGIHCDWDDRGGSLTRRLGIAVRSIPHCARMTAYRVLRQVD